MKRDPLTFRQVVLTVVFLVCLLALIVTVEMNGGFPKD
jgi:hypothetical protein